MDIEEYKKLARNKLEADALTKQVRDVIKITKWQKQDAREGFKETFKPLIESQDSVKKSIDKQQDSLIKQLRANQLALTQGLNRNRLAELDICRIHVEEYHEPVFALSSRLFCHL